MGFWRHLRNALFRPAAQTAIGSAPPSPPVPPAAPTDRVRFVRKYTEPTAVGPAFHYEMYRAAKAETAREFLRQKSVTEPYYYIVCETEEGNWGLDNEGLYLERLLPWQQDTSRYDCDGRTTGLTWSSLALSEAAQGRKDNFVMRITCGHCAVEWYDGVRYNNVTICKCPQCGSRNRVDTTNIQAVFVGGP